MTKVDRKRRFGRLFDIGCIVCKLHYGVHTPPCIHHLQGTGCRGIGMRADDSLTIPLCPRHHQYGTNEHPSVHSHPKLFRELYGTEAELLEETNRLLNA